MALDKAEQALKDGQALIALQPENPRAYMVVGRALLARGEVEAVRKKLNKALELETEPALRKLLEDTLADINKTSLTGSE